MIDYSQWPTKNLPVSKLLLDPENPRIPPTDQHLSQDELLAELIEHDSVHPLAKKIATNGYYADELLIVAPHDGSYVVVEGNRRLAALKALLSPEAAPEKHRKKFRALAKGLQKNLIKSVGVILAPSRQAALPRIAEKHTRSMLENWKPAQKARFYTSLVDGGRSTDQVCRDFDLARGELDAFLRSGTLYEMACSLDLPDDVQRKVENPRSFPLTNLERFVESKHGQRFLGIKSDLKHIFKGSVKRAEFKKGLAKVVTDVVVEGDDGINSRVLNNEAAIRAYVSRIKAHEPDKSQKGSFTPKSIIKAPATGAVSAGKRQAKRTPGRATTKLIRSDLKCAVGDPRITGVFTELRRMKLAEFPNATAIMLRVLLELSVSHFIQCSGKNKDLLKRIDPNSKKPREWYPSLRQQLLFVTEEMTLPLEPLELRALKAFAKKRSDDALALDELDGFVHNKYMVPAESDIRSIFAKIEPLLRITLAEPTPGAN